MNNLGLPEGRVPIEQYFQKQHQIETQNVLTLECDEEGIWLIEHINDVPHQCGCVEWRDVARYLKQYEQENNR